MLSHDLSDLLSRELFPDSALKTLGTVDKLTVQIAKNGFSSVRKKRSRTELRRGFLTMQSESQASKMYRLIIYRSLLFGELQDRAAVAACDQCGIAVKVSVFDLGLTGLPFGAARCELFVADLHLQFVGGDID